MPMHTPSEEGTVLHENIRVSGKLITRSHAENGANKPWDQKKNGTTNTGDKKHRANKNRGQQMGKNGTNTPVTKTNGDKQNQGQNNR